MKKGKNKKLSIAQFHWGFPPIIGGVETHLTILMPTLVQMGYKVNLLTGTAGGGTKVVENYHGVGIRRVPVMDLNWLYERGLTGLEEETGEVFNGFIEKCKPDIIHVHNMHYFSKMHAKTLENISLAKGIPIVLTAHNVWDDNLFLDLMKNIRWNHVIAVSHYIKREILGVGCDHRLVTVVHHGINQNIFNPHVKCEAILKRYPRLKNTKVIFHPARMGMAKGCDVSIKALRIIKEQIPDIMLILAGTKNIIDWGATQQKDIAYMVSLVNFLKLRDNVLIDSYTLEDMPKLYAASLVCMYPSSGCEPFGLTMLEAIASRKPIVVTDAGGMPEIIKDGINGFVVPIKNFEELAARILHLLKNDKLRDRLGRTGREMVEQSYTKEIMTQNTISVYEKVLYS